MEGFVLFTCNRQSEKKGPVILGEAIKHLKVQMWGEKSLNSLEVCKNPTLRDLKYLEGTPHGVTG